MSAKWSSTNDLGNANVDFGELLKDEYGVIFLQGKNMFGDIIYSYLKVALPDLARLRAALQSDDPFNPTDYGSIIAAGKGEPTSEVKADIAINYRMFDSPKPVVSSAGNAPIEKKSWDDY